MTFSERKMHPGGDSAKVLTKLTTETLVMCFVKSHDARKIRIKHLCVAEITWHTQRQDPTKARTLEIFSQGPHQKNVPSLRLASPWFLCPFSCRVWHQECSNFNNSWTKNPAPSSQTGIDVLMKQNMGFHKKKMVLKDERNNCLLFKLYLKLLLLFLFTFCF